jgi:gamma-glutamyltranspeptidase
MLDNISWTFYLIDINVANVCFREIFLNSNGGLLVEGDLFKRPKLAVTLRRIADDGAVKFYNGTLADDIVADIQDHGMFSFS